MSNRIWPVKIYPAGRVTANWTGRIPRTLNEAFGPMSSGLLFKAGRNESRRTVRAIQFITCAAAVSLFTVAVFALTA